MMVNDYHMQLDTPAQKKAHETLYGNGELAKYSYHVSSDPLTRYLRDRRLHLALEILRETYGEEVFGFSVLSVCGGVGGEGVFFRRAGFRDVTVSDFSENALQIAKSLDGSLKTLAIDAEAMDLSDRSFDIVLVHDGLHHLPRPGTGFAEMLRVAKRAAIVIEPYNGLVGDLLGQEWEMTEGEMNFVYRWDRKMIEQTAKSFLLKKFKMIIVRRLWDHGLLVSKIVGKLPHGWKLLACKVVYGILRPLNFTGNNLVAVVVKE